MKSKERKDKSLYGNSMKVLANLVKMSSFSLAKRNVRETENESAPEPRNRLQPVKSIVTVGKNPTFKIPEQKTATPKPISYLVNEGYRSSYVVPEDMNVDGRASDFIQKVHKNNQSDLLLMSELY